LAVRGGPEDRLKALGARGERLAVEQALAYDLAVRRRYKDVIISRRNYDVAPARCRFIASVLQAGRIRAAPLPWCGHAIALAISDERQSK
jgi:hypothetical protein